MSWKDIPKLPNRKFTSKNAVCNNGVFLLTVQDTPPFSAPCEGWKFVGYGKAPWPKGGSDFAMMLEKTTPAGAYPSHRGEEMAEGTQLWHHYDEDHWRYYVEGKLT